MKRQQFWKKGLMQFIQTEDGSLTCRDQVTGELYHNSAGAYQEALINYVRASGALERLRRNRALKVVDVCFGLGYNSFVLLEEALKAKISGHIEIVGIEIDTVILGALPTILDLEMFAELKHAISNQKAGALGSEHDLDSEHEPTLSVLKSNCVASESARTLSYSFSSEPKNFSAMIKIYQHSLGEILPELSGDYDFVFHDPFSPNRMPELWTVEIFKIYQKLLETKNGAVLTYSAASAISAGLKEAGFEIARTAALGKKASGSIAYFRQSEDMECRPLSLEEENRLLTRSGIPYRDPSFTFNRRMILAARECEQGIIPKSD